MNAPFRKTGQRTLIGDFRKFIKNVCRKLNAIYNSKKRSFKNSIDFI